MKRVFYVVLALLLLLSGCNRLAPAESQASDLPAAATPAPSSAAAQEVTTEHAVRSLYEGEEAPAIREITAYGKDFLVQLDDLGYSQFDWVYGLSGIRREIVRFEEGVQSVAITGPACVQILTDGVSAINGYRSFPHLIYAGLTSVYDENGQAWNYGDDIWPTLSGEETYWAGVGEEHSFGMFGRREAVASAQVEISGLSMSFAPLADGSDFVAAFCAPPGTEISFDETTHTMVVTCSDTFLDSGAWNPDAGFSEAWLEEYGSLYPDDFPAGALNGYSRLILSASIRQAGNDAVVTMKLADKVEKYTVESGYEGPADLGPYFRIVLRCNEDF